MQPFEIALPNRPSAIRIALAIVHSVSVLSSLLFLISTSAAQNCNVEFRHLTVADGISHSQVNAIVQDRQGFLWFGTRFGLNRYDGYECKIYTHNLQDTNSLSGGFILSLCATRDGRLWIGTQGNGLNCLDLSSGKISVYRREFGATAPTVVCLLEDAGGTLWAGTSTGLYRVLRDSMHVRLELFVDSRAEMSNEAWNRVRTIYEDAQGDLWIGTEQGVKRLTRNNRAARSFIAYPHNSNDPGSLGNGIVNSITSDWQGRIWVGTRRGSVRRLEVATGKVKQILGNVQVRSLYTDRDGNIWLGALDQGLYRFTPTQSGDDQICNFRNGPDQPASLGSNEIQSIYQDRSGKLFIGTFGAGISIIDPMRRKFVHYVHVPNDPTSLSGNIVRTLAEDPQGNLWVGTSGGGLNLLLRGAKHFTRYPTMAGGPANNPPTHVVARRNGEIWVSFAFSGLMRVLPDGRRIYYRHTPGDTTGLVGVNVIRTMYEDRKGRLWIGTHGYGLWRYDEQANLFVRFLPVQSDSTSISGNHVWSIADDSDGNIWLGTWNRGLNRFDPEKGTFERFLNRPGDSTTVSGDPILSITEDREQNLWMGTAGGGLQMLKRGSHNVERFTKGNGFPDNMAYGVLVDERNFLWVSTGNGLVRFEIGTHAATVFDVSDGLQSTEFLQGSCCKGKDGRMYFGGINGFNVFHPDSIRSNPTQPPIVITRFAVFDKEISLPSAITIVKEITLERDQNFFSFEFAALDYTAPVKNRYAYRLGGFDRDWIHAGNRRLASYTNVGPGTYVFRVRGSNNDGVWNNVGTSIIVTVLPAFWETWWFRMLVAAVVAGLLYSFYYYRINKLLAVQHTRERIARDLHDEVSAILSGVSYFSRAVHDDSGNRLTERSAHFISLINRSSHEVLELLHDIIWSINPEGDHFENVAAKLRRYASDLCESRSIHYSISIPETLPRRTVSSEKRKNFWLIYKEMVTNAVRHSECTELSIQLALDGDGRVRLHVSDNGRGFDSDGRNSNHGLKNIRARAASLNAALQLRTAPGAGTSWDLRCPLLE